MYYSPCAIHILHNHIYTHEHNYGGDLKKKKSNTTVSEKKWGKKQIMIKEMRISTTAKIVRVVYQREAIDALTNALKLYDAACSSSIIISIYYNEHRCILSADILKV